MWMQPEASMKRSSGEAGGCQQRIWAGQRQATNKKKWAPMKRVIQGGFQLECPWGILNKCPKQKEPRVISLHQRPTSHDIRNQPVKSGPFTLIRPGSWWARGGEQSKRKDVMHTTIFIATFKPDKGYRWGRENFKFEWVWDLDILPDGKFLISKMGLFSDWKTRKGDTYTRCHPAKRTSTSMEQI